MTRYNYYYNRRNSAGSDSIGSDWTNDSSTILHPMVAASSEFVMRHRSEIRHRTSKRKTLTSSMPTASTSSIDLLAHGGFRPDTPDDYEYSHKEDNKSTVMSKSKLGLSKKSRLSTWELWWILSPLWRRSLVFSTVIMLLITILHLLAGIYFISHSGPQKRSPQVCATWRCTALSEWLSQSSNLDLNPCGNFYEFTCANHKRDDKGNLWEFWYSNFARLETDGANGESILAKILQDTPTSDEDDIVGTRIIGYYKVCMKMWHTEPLGLDKSLGILITSVFGEFDLWAEHDKQPSFQLERMATRMIQLVGDAGFYKVYAPVSYPEVMFTSWQFITQIKESNVKNFLPIIYDALGIPQKAVVVRNKLNRYVYRVGALLNSLILSGKPEFQDGSECIRSGSRTAKSANLKDNYDFDLPFYLAYHGEQDVDLSDSKWPKLKNGKMLNIKMDPGKGPKFIRNYEALLSNWNCFIAKIIDINDLRYIRPVYATFWSLRLLIELAHDADDETANEWGLSPHHNNEFFSVFQLQYHGRTKESRCFQSMSDAMGYYPIFRFFRTSAPELAKNYKKSAFQVIEHARKTILDEFRPPEEGGLPYISSRYRERMYRLLGDEDATNIILPGLEDDLSFPRQLVTSDELAIKEDHVENIIAWRRFTWRRTLHFWKKKDSEKKGKLVWYKSFYQLDKAQVYEAPSTVPVTLIKFPPSIFIHPFWNNDLEVANYAGARMLAVKTWMLAITWYSADSNVVDEIEMRKTSGVEYREGVTTDADHEPCTALTYDWFYSKKDDNDDQYALDQFDPHFLALRYGFVKGPERNDWVEYGLGIWQTSFSAKVMLRKYREEMRALRNSTFWGLDAKSRVKLKYNQLIGYETFNEEQLFFLINFRELCRSIVESSEYNTHVTENWSGLMQMEEFSEVWQCPPGSTMNPEDKCFR